MMMSIRIIKTSGPGWSSAFSRVPTITVNNQVSTIIFFLFISAIAFLLDSSLILIPSLFPTSTSVVHLEVSFLVFQLERALRSGITVLIFLTLPSYRPRRIQAHNEVHYLVLLCSCCRVCDGSRLDRPGFWTIWDRVSSSGDISTSHTFSADQSFGDDPLFLRKMINYPTRSSSCGKPGECVNSSVLTTFVLALLWYLNLFFPFFIFKLPKQWDEWLLQGPKLLLRLRKIIATSKRGHGSTRIIFS